MFLSDYQITSRAKKGMIEPFYELQVSKDANNNKLISYGLSSYGYDARLDSKFLIPKFEPTSNPIVDPKDANKNDYHEYEGNVIDIPPHSFVLGQTIEYFRVPRDVLALCLNKSTYARCGIVVNVTPLEPEWEGTVTIEISNTNVKPVRVYANEGVAQFLFAWCDPYTVYGKCFNNMCKTSYADRKGKYQCQTQVTLPKMK